MTLPISPIMSSAATQSAALDVALRPGTTITAQVLKLLDANLVRLAIANLSLDVATTMPLQPGQTLQLAVNQTKDGVSLTPVVAETPNAPRGAAVVIDDIPLAPQLVARTADPVLSPAVARVVSLAAQDAATKQAGLSPLFANLSVATQSGQLPPPILHAAMQVLTLRQPTDKTFTGADVKSAMASSGLLREPMLASSAATEAIPDMKAALTTLRQLLATWVSGSPQTDNPSPAAQQMPVRGQTARFDVTRAIDDIIAEPETQSIYASEGPVGSTKPTSSNGVVAHDVASKTIPLAMRPNVPPPLHDALPSAQSVAAPTLASDTEPATIIRQLIADTDGALARQTLLQIASLPDQSGGARNEAMQPRWHFEIPFATPQGTAMAQFFISQDDGGHRGEATTQRVWRARFSLDIEPAGPVHALISFSGETTSVKMWAERPATAAQLRANAVHLSASLDRADLKTGDILIADGAPVQAQTQSVGRFLNRAS